MKLLCRLLPAVLAVATCAVSHANPLPMTIDSGIGSTTYFGYCSPDKTSCTNANSPAVTIGTGTPNVWGSPIGNSQWISLAAGTQPGGSVVEPNGFYYYATFFNITSPSTTTGSITVMADDSTAVYLNNTMITPVSGSSAAQYCLSGTPSCTVAATYVLPTSGFVAGSNYIGFAVDQMYSSATGLDFEANISTTATPEPSSLLLLATGLTGAAGALRRRIAA